MLVSLSIFPAVVAGMPWNFPHQRQRLQKSEYEAEAWRDQAWFLGAKSLVLLPLFLLFLWFMDGQRLMFMWQSPSGPTLVILTLTTWVMPCWHSLRCCRSKAGWRSGTSSFIVLDRYEIYFGHHSSTSFRFDTTLGWTLYESVFCYLNTSVCADSWHLHPCFCLPGMHDWPHPVCRRGHCKFQRKQGKSKHMATESSSARTGSEPGLIEMCLPLSGHCSAYGWPEKMGRSEESTENSTTPPPASAPRCFRTKENTCASVRSCATHWRHGALRFIVSHVRR